MADWLAVLIAIASVATAALSLFTVWRTQRMLKEYEVDLRTKFEILAESRIVEDSEQVDSPQLTDLAAKEDV